MHLIEAKFPGYLHELFWYAHKMLGLYATFGELSEIMNYKSAVDGEERMSLMIGRWQLASWFVENKGKEISPLEKPLLSDDHKLWRKLWVNKYQKIIKDKNTPIAYLDEKWFYTTNHQNKLKILPEGRFEYQGNCLVNYPKIRSRHFPVKVMYLGVVVRPRMDDHEFDGKILLQRVSKPVVLSQTTRNKQF